MKAIWRFRLLSLFIFLFVAGVSISNLTAEFLRPAALPLASIIDKAPSQDQVASASLASTIAPFRADLKADYAIALAGQAIQSANGGQSEKISMAENAATSALKIGPHDSRTWLALALLQARNNPVDPRIAGALRLSYLTGPNRTELIPVRLRTAASGTSLSDTDLSELARTDVRAVLTQFPDSMQVLGSSYAAASEIGKRFLEESVRTIDPKFADALRHTK
jgi:hypothetical protein